MDLCIEEIYGFSYPDFIIFVAGKFSLKSWTTMFDVFAVSTAKSPFNQISRGSTRGTILS